MILITSGCSFSACEDPKKVATWPLQLEKSLNIEHHPLAVRGQDNGMIARRVIHYVNEQLTKTPAEEILVGIMWSGLDRNSFYCDNIQDYEHNFEGDGKIKKLSLTEDDSGAWLLMNAHWNSKYNKAHYTSFSNDKWDAIQTLEHILRTQWFLKQNNINYFMMSMTCYLFQTFEMYKDDANINYLIEMIDHSKFAETHGCQQWCEKLQLPFRSEGDYHPTSEMHEIYTRELIIPYLTKNNMLGEPEW